MNSLSFMSREFFFKLCNDIFIEMTRSVSDVNPLNSFLSSASLIVLTIRYSVH